MISKRNSKEKASSKQKSFDKYATTGEYGSVPSFLLKTYEFVNDPKTDEIISWNKAGDAFVIYQTSSFCERILPQYFSHKNFSSFVRQLNMYGFNKNKGLRNDQSFSNPLFKRDNMKLLLKLKRKIKETKDIRKTKENANYVKSNEFLNIMKKMKETSQEQEKRIAQLESQNKEFKNSVLALYAELERMKERESNSSHIHFDFGSLLKNQNISGNIKDANDKSMVSQNLSNLVANILKGAQKTENAPSSSFMSNYSSCDQNSKNLMIENGTCSPKPSFSESKDSAFKKREVKSIKKEEASFQNSPIINQNSSADLGMNLAEMNLSEKPNLLSIDHSVASDLDILNNENSVKGEFTGLYSPPSPALSINGERQLAIMPKSPSISEYLRTHKDKSSDSLSSFSAGGSLIKKEIPE